MLRVKGFVDVEGKPMRLLVQAVGPRVNHHFDRAWAPGEERRSRLVVIGLKGLEPSGDRDASSRADREHFGVHILATTSASLDDLAEPVDLRQSPADVVALSFTDSDLAGLAAAWQADAKSLPSMRLAALRELRHPMSVDLWIDSVARARQGHPGAHPRRLRMVALRLRPARRAGARARHRARAVAGRMPRRSTNG